MRIAAVRGCLMLGLLGLQPTELSAQESFSFSWQVQDIAGTGPTNSNGIIEPGEDAMIYLFVSYRPGVGGTAIWDTNGGDGREGTVVGLGEVLFDIRATSTELRTGSWVSTGAAPGFNLAPIGSVDPESNSLIGMIFGQYPFPGEIPDPRNDDWFFRARWRPNGFAPRTVDFVWRNGLNSLDPRILLDAGFRDPNGLPEYVGDRWSFNEPAGSFQVIPAPCALSLIAFAFTAAQRRRACGPTIHTPRLPLTAKCC